MALEDTDKVYRGAFDYLDQNRPYSEETYDVFKHPIDGSYTFQAEILTRVANGEFLKVRVLYVLSRTFQPMSVVIDKNLGSQKVQEIYACDYKNQVMNYSFITDEETTEKEIGIPPKFFIATPAACTSFLYFNSKKFDQGGKNYYTVFTSDNLWEFEEEPFQERITVETPNSSSINIKSGENQLTCHLYLVTKDDEESKQNPINFYVSKHIGIPYRIQGPNKIKVEVRYLNHLEPSSNTLI